MVAGQYCSTQMLASAHSFPTGQGCLGSSWGKKWHFEITHLQMSYPACLGKLSSSMRPRGNVRTEFKHFGLVSRTEAEKMSS